MGLDELQQKISDDMRDFREIVKDRLYSEHGLYEINKWIYSRKVQYYPITCCEDDDLAMKKFLEAVEKECENLLSLAARIYSGNVVSRKADS